MPIRLAKRLIYGAFYVILWGAFLGLAWLLFRSAPPPPAPPEPAPVAVLGVANFPVPGEPGYETLLAKIANQNQNVASPGFDYAFDAYGASGTLLAAFPGQSFLYGSEVKYIVLVNQEVPSGTLAFDLSVPTSTTQWTATSTFGPPPTFTTQNISTTIGSSSVAATGQIFDGDTASFSNVLIVAIFKDASGVPVAVSQTELGSIAPGQTENFSASYPALAGVNPAATEVDAYAVRE